MKVLFVCRPNSYTVHGGDTVHMDGLAAGLRALGVHVDIQPTLQPEAEGYDVVHVFDMMTPLNTALQVSHAGKHTDAPLIITPWFIDVQQELACSPVFVDGIAGQMDSGNPQDVRIDGYQRPPTSWSAYEVLQQAALNVSTHVVCASECEADWLHRDYDMERIQTCIIRTACDASAVTWAPDLFHSKYQVRDFVLCAGRVEPRKNQAGMLLAMRDFDVPVVLAGSLAQPEYYALCQRVRPQTHFLGHLSREMTLSAIAACRVHVLPSWWECPGIASLEAAAMGKPIVTGTYAAEPEYFGSIAHACQPDNTASIGAAVLAALADGRLAERRAFADKARDYYTWARVAREHLELYQDAIA